MSRVRITTSGRRRLRRLSADMARAAGRAVQAGADDVRETAREQLGEPGGGRPSAPGEPPHRQTGQLRDSVFARATRDGLGAEIGTDLDYGAYLEFGTQAMPARPWLLPAFEAAKPRITARIASAVRDAMKRGT